MWHIFFLIITSEGQVGKSVNSRIKSKEIKISEDGETYIYGANCNYLLTFTFKLLQLYCNEEEAINNTRKKKSAQMRKGSGRITEDIRTICHVGIESMLPALHVSVNRI